MSTKGSKKGAPAAQQELDEVHASGVNGSAIAPLAAASSEIAIPGLPTLDPEQYAAAVFEPFNKKLEAEAASAELIVFTEEQLLALPEDRRKLAKVVDISTTAGMDLAIKYRAFFRDDVRLAGEDARAERKAPILTIGRLLDSKYKALVEKAAPYEARFDKAIQDEKTRKAEIKAAAEKAEAERVNAIRVKIAAIRNLPSQQVGATSVELRAVLATLAAREITADEFSTFTGEAQLALDATGQELLGLLSLAITRENEEAARVKALAEEQARIAAQAEANRLETERLAKLAREHELAEQERQRVAAVEQAERARVAADTRRQMEAQQAEVTRACQQQDAEVAKTSMAMEQISAIQHQLLVAEAGRAPYCKGGDIESFEFALKGTREWVVDEANFGGLAGIAQMAKDNVITKLEAGLEKLRAQAAADAARIAAMAPPAAIPPEVVAASVAAQEAAPEPVCQLLVPAGPEQDDAATELAGAATLDAFDKRSVDALKMAIWDLLQTRTADEVRALVEAELVEFGKMGGA